MSVRAQACYSNPPRGIRHIPATPGSNTQRRRAGFAKHGGHHDPVRKGGGLNSHWCGIIIPGAKPGHPGADKDAGRYGI